EFFCLTVPPAPMDRAVVPVVDARQPRRLPVPRLFAPAPAVGRSDDVDAAARRDAGPPPSAPPERGRVLRAARGRVPVVVAGAAVRRVAVGVRLAGAELHPG